MKVGGAVVPGATISIDDHLTGLVEVGYRLNPNMSLAFTGGFPPDIDIDGAGTAAPFGRVGGILYGPTALTLHIRCANGAGSSPMSASARCSCSSSTTRTGR